MITTQSNGSDGNALFARLEPHLHTLMGETLHFTRQEETREP